MGVRYVKQIIVHVNTPSELRLTGEGRINIISDCVPLRDNMLLNLELVSVSEPH